MPIRFSHFRFAFAALVAMLGVCPASAQTPSAMTPSEIAAKATPAVVAIMGENLNGRPFLPGRGFLLGPNVIATDYAVVRDASKVYAKTADGKKKEARILGVDARLAVAILAVSEIKVAPLSLGNSDTVAIGEAVYIIDSPNATRQGVISDDLVINGKRYLKMPGQVSDDSRGCPVLNDRGEVIAVTVSDPTRRETCGFAVPASYLKRLGYLSIEGFGSEADKRREFRRPEGAQEARSDVNLRPRYIRKSGSILQREAVRQVIPLYPPLAKAARVVGLVVVEMVINENGEVISARAISGHQFLKEAALAASRGWKFRPVKTQEPVRIIGTITFNFTS